MWGAIIDFVGKQGPLDFVPNLFDTVVSIGDRIEQRNQLDLENQFAFDNRDYERALQQQIFDREDTAYSRSIYDMMNSGLSPLSMSGTNNSGAVVTQTNSPNKNINYSPINAAGMMRGLTDTLIAIEENNRQQALAENTIAFNSAQVSKMLADTTRSDQQQIIDFELNNQRIANDYKLGLFDLMLKNEELVNDKQFKNLQLDLQRDIFESERYYRGLAHKMEVDKFENQKILENFSKSLQLNDLFLRNDDLKFRKDVHSDSMKVESDKLFYEGIRNLIDIGGIFYGSGR